VAFQLSATAQTDSWGCYSHPGGCNTRGTVHDSLPVSGLINLEATGILFTLACEPVKKTPAA